MSEPIIYERVTAQVKFFAVEKGFGFLKRANKPDIYLSIRALERSGLTSVKQNDTLEFDLVPIDGKGGRAINIKKIDNSLPLIGVLSAEASIQTSSIPLSRIRSLLLPGLWATNTEYGSDYESDIMIDYKSDALIVKAYRFSTKQEFSFAILRSSIDSDRYKVEFKPSVEKLFKVVSQAQGV